MQKLGNKLRILGLYIGKISINSTSGIPWSRHRSWSNDKYQMVSAVGLVLDSLPLIFIIDSCFLSSLYSCFIENLPLT